MLEEMKLILFQLLKIFVILSLTGFIINFFKTYVSQQKIKEKLFQSKGFEGQIRASVYGAISPFSSKYSIKFFFNLLESGIPSRIAISFLISSAIINEYVVILMLFFFGWKITGIYVFSGILIGVFSGVFFSKRGYDKYISKKLKKTDLELSKNYSIKERAIIGFKETTKILKKMFLFITIGFSIYMIIQSRLPESSVENIISFMGYFGVLIAILIGIPFKGDGYALVPIAVGLFEKGVPLGTALSFLMAVIAINFSTGRKLRIILDKKLIRILFLTVIISIAIIGYLLNFLVDCC